jgi:N utilization substance protein B
VGRRRRAREYALQVLFQIDLTGGSAAEVLDGFWSGWDADEDVRSFTERLVHGVLADREAIDRRISEAAQHWRLERMPVVDRNVLRVAVHELGSEDNPPSVVIDEAIEVAKRFGSEGSGAFINGILDAIRVRIEAERRRAGPEGRWA